MLAALRTCLGMNFTPWNKEVILAFMRFRVHRHLERLIPSTDPHVCPFCMTRYKDTKRAVACHKTQACRIMNSPVDRYAWEMQVTVCVLTLVLTEAILNEAPEEEVKLREVSAEIGKVADSLTSHLRHRYPVGRLVAEQNAKRIKDAMVAVWPGHEVRYTELASIVQPLVEDVLMTIEDGEVWNMRGDDEGRRIWRRLSYLTGRLHDLLTDGEEEDTAWHVAAGYDALFEIAFGAAPYVRPPSLYLVADRWYVAARGRAQARKHIREQYGLVNAKVKGIAPGVKFDDDESAQDILNATATIPSVVGMAG